MEDDSDTHLCLRCQRLFRSLDSYVQHRKSTCVPSKSSLTSIPSYSVVSENELRPDDFFHSLQLQSNSNTPGSGVEKNKIIVKIEEVVLGPKVIENEVEDDEIEEDEVEDEPPPGHTGGKWKPGCSPRKRCRSSSGETRSNDDHDYVLKVVPRDSIKVFAGPKSRKEAFMKSLLKETENCCGLCTVQFNSKEALVKHLCSSQHWKRRGENEEEHADLILLNAHHLAPNSPFKCSVCSFYFNNYDYLVEHWKTNVEQHGESERDSLGFNCSACEVNVKTTNEMITHLTENNAHLENVERIQSSGKSLIISTADVLHCPHCDWTGKRQQTLNFHITWKHMKVESNNETYKCSKCSFVGKRKTSLLAHERRAHPVKNNDVVNDSKTDTAAAEEMETTNELEDADWTGEDSKSEPEKGKKKYMKKHSCIYCGKLIGAAVQLQNHIRKVHPDKMFHCDICGVYFELEAMLIKHQSSRLHKYHTDGLAENTGDPTGEDHSCDQCNFKSFSKSGLLFHQAMHQGVVDESNEEQGLDGNQERSKRNNTYRCPICLEIFKLNVLRTHLISHTGERPYPCQWCKESFMAKITLSSHIRTKHREKKFACSFCPYKSQRRTKLISHMDIHQQKEARVRKFLCDSCGAGFFNQSSLKHHMRLHLPFELGGKTQICSFPGCRLSFRSPSELVYHTRVHTGERPYLCTNCGYSAKTKHQLTKHERSHNGERPFKCRHCSYAAALSSQLLRHVRIHTGAKPYSCPYCEYTCNTHENLRKHVLKSKKHVGLNVYKCPHCDYGCNLANELKSHMLNEHRSFSDVENAHDMAFSSVVSGIFSRNEDRRDIDQPSTPYVPRTEKPGYREKMRQTWKPKISGISSYPTVDEIPDLMIDEADESKARVETEMNEKAKDMNEKQRDIDRFFAGIAEDEMTENNNSCQQEVHFRQLDENFTVVVENGDDELEATTVLKQLLESNAIVIDSGNADAPTTIPLTVLNNMEMGSTLMEASDENGATVFLCMPVSP